MILLEGFHTEASLGASLISDPHPPKNQSTFFIRVPYKRVASSGRPSAISLEVSKPFPLLTARSEEEDGLW